MSDDPLTALVARSLGAEVADVSSELVAKDGRREIERISFRQNGHERSLLLVRLPPGEALEVQLLPFLARKSDRVPEVRSRGIPPKAVPAWPWVLLEDVLGAPSACDGEVGEIVHAKAAIERAVVHDAPALGALGVPTRSATELVAQLPPSAADERTFAEARAAVIALDAWPRSLCHGDLRCANALATARGVLLIEWRQAYLGCALLDVARLTADLQERGTPVAVDLFGLYAERVGVAVCAELARAATLVERLVRGIGGH